MQSIYGARLVLHIVILLLLWGAIGYQSWNVFDVRIHQSINSASDALEKTTDTNTSTVEAVAFTPSAYCYYYGNSSMVCNSYAFLLGHIGEAKEPAMPTDTEENEDAEEAERLDEVLSSWCVITDEGLWFVQGAQTMICLIILDTCFYTMVLWILVATLAVCLSFVSMHSRLSAVDKCNLVCSYMISLLGMLVVVEWWAYSAYFINKGYLASLSLTWHYGASFRFAIAALLVSLPAMKITMYLAVNTLPNYAQLHAASAAPASSGSPASSDEEACLTPPNPLECRANYIV